MKKNQIFHQVKGMRVLSRNELKMITGGPVDPPEACPGKCGGGDRSPWETTCEKKTGPIQCMCISPLASWSTCGQ